MTDVQQAVPVAQEYPATAIGALTGYQRQIDSDGTFVGVSRQALDELIAWAETRRLPLPCKSGEGAGEVGDFVMVPRKLTDDMLEAVVKLDFTSTHDPLWPEYWAAVLDAAPTIPDATQTREAEGGGRTDAEIVEQANNLAREFYARRGYEVPAGYRFHQASHPHEVEAWDMACLAIETLTDTDAQDAADNLDDAA